MIHEIGSAEGQKLLLFGANGKLRIGGVRPMVNKAGNIVVNSGGLAVNSMLYPEEWKELDAIIYPMVRQYSTIYEDLKEAGLTKPIKSLGTLLSQWRVGSERSGSGISMDGRTRTERDRSDRETQASPVPIFSQDYSIGTRELEASRNSGDSFDTTEAAEAAQAQGDTITNVIFNGSTAVSVGGNTISGIINVTGRVTGTAASFGGGDFGTEGNGRKTIIGMMSSLSANRYRGPFNVYVSNTQYMQLLARHTDGSGQSELDTITSIDDINKVESVDATDLPDGNVAVVQMTPNVIDLGVHTELDNREWTSPDGMEFMAKIITVLTTRIKKDSAGNVGIAHATAA